MQANFQQWFTGRNKNPVVTESIKNFYFRLLFFLKSAGRCFLEPLFTKTLESYRELVASRAVHTFFA